MTQSTWTCVSCGRVGNTSTYCGTCGSAGPEERAVSAPTGFQAVAPASGGSYAPPRPVSSPMSSGMGGAPRPLSDPGAPGIALMRGETTQIDVSFSPHLILQHLRTRVLLTDRRVIVQWPHTLFGVIPLGYACGSAPLDAINQVNHGHMMRSGRVLAGASALAAGVLTLFAGSQGVLITLLLFALAAVMFMTARVTGVFFDTGGNHLLAAAGRGRDTAAVEETAQRVIEAIQVAHDR